MPAQPPVTLEPYDSRWPAKFEVERWRLSKVLQPWLAGPIEHVGSTAVPGLLAKPIIDIMAAVRDLPSSRPAIEALIPLSYCYAPYKADVMHWFCKPSEFERTHHLHLVPLGGGHWRERLAFRDALRASEELRSGYTALKAELASKFKGDRDAYTEGKTEFVSAVLAACRS
jgi:GrpB-like predicted nucleotidyltransferase (UPF0157 family)